MEGDHPTKVCIQCKEDYTKAGYAKRQWKSEQPLCRLCAESNEASGQQQPKTKICIQCNQDRDRDQFPRKQWKKEQPVCRLCDEFTKTAGEESRKCRECKLDLPRNRFAIYQWGKGADALCHDCREQVEAKIRASIGTPRTSKDLPDGTVLCEPHSLECCDICMVDYGLTNQYARKSYALGRDLTPDEMQEINAQFFQKNDMQINRKICIMDGQSMCPRTGRKLRCPCNEVTYCSQACQKHHWTIHKMTCEVHAKKKRDKAQKRAKEQATQHHTNHGLTEEQLDNIRIEAFMAENSGAQHSIEECAWQLGEHPLVIGGGSIQICGNGGGEKFIRGDVAKIYREQVGKVWDGSPRFGLGPYVQQKTPFDWVAKARQRRTTDL